MIYDYDLYRAISYASAALAVVILCPSVRLSVCHTRVLWQKQTMHCIYFDTTRKGNHSLVFSGTNNDWRPTPHSVWNLRSKWPTPHSKCQLWQISAYNASTVRDIKKRSIMTNRKSTMGFPVSYRWSAYITPALSPRMGGSKGILCFFYKMQL